MAQLIKKVQNQLLKKGYAPRSAESRKWLLQKVNSLSPSSSKLMLDRERLKNFAMIGRMYFFYYDAKTKEKLPYWDMFPLVIPIDKYSDGFLGLNLHYVYPKIRLKILDELSEFATNKKYDEKTRLKLSYNMLIGASRALQTLPCLKRYLFSHIQSRFLEIEANEWDIAAVLPVENFQKASPNKVWNESRKKY